MNQQTAGWRIRAVNEQILFIAGFGDWSTETAQAFCSESREITETLLSDPWAFLCDATDWVINDPGVQKLLKEQIAWNIGKGCRVGSFYTGNRGMNRLLLYRLLPTDSENCRFRVFPDRQRSAETISDGGIPLNHQQLGGFFRGEGTR